MSKYGNDSNKYFCTTHYFREWNFGPHACLSHWWGEEHSHPFYLLFGAVYWSGQSRVFLHLRWQKMISPSNWPYFKNHCTIQASVVSCKRQNYFLGLYLQKKTIVQFWFKKCCILLDSHLWKWVTGRVALLQPKCNWSVGFAIAPRSLRVKRPITHALCSPAYSDIAGYKPFPILTMKGLYCVFFAYNTPYGVLND